MIEIIEGYSFDFDDRQYTLYRTGVREKREFGTGRLTGEMVGYKETLGYYSRMRDLIAAVLRVETKRRAAEENVQTLREYLQLADEIGRRLVDAQTDAERREGGGGP